jgi:hypothetical protein
MTAVEKIMCNYKKSNPQPKNIPNPRVQFESECGFKLVLNEGFNMNWQDYKKYRNPILPSGKCMKCNNDINFKQVNKQK